MSPPHRFHSLGVMSAVVIIAVSAGAAVRQRSIVFIHATVIDATAPARSNQTVVITGERIVAVGPSSAVKVPSGSRVVDATGRFLIPGLWDAHVHTRYDGVDHLRLSIANGITSVRDMAGHWDHLSKMNQWRTDIAKGLRVGPRLRVAGPLLDGPGSAWSHAAIVNGPEDARETVRRLKREGTDFVKVYSLLSRESFLAIAEEAKAQDLMVVGHVPGAVSILDAVDHGQHGIEHLDNFLLEATERAQWPNDPSRTPSQAAALYRERFRPATVTATARHLVRMHASVTPTLSLYWTRLGAARNDSAVIDGERTRYVPRQYMAEWARVARRPAADEQTFFELFTQTAAILHSAGVQFLAGTDVIKPYFIPGFGLHDELRLLVQAGLSPIEAIEAATVNPARFLGLRDVGTIEPGMIADIAVLTANPLTDIENTRNVEIVVTSGRLFTAVMLRDMRLDIQRKAAAWTGKPTGR